MVRLMPSLLFAALSWWIAGAHAQSFLPQAASRSVEDIRPLLLEALNAPSGEAHAVLSGPVARGIQARFGSSLPIHIDVQTQRRYSQAGCSRLVVTMWQDGVRLPDRQQAGRQTLEMGLNYCRDGMPPRALD